MSLDILTIKNNYPNLNVYFLNEAIIAADELNMSLEEYIEFLCDEQFDLSFDEAYKANLI